MFCGERSSFSRALGLGMVGVATGLFVGGGALAQAVRYVAAAAPPGGDGMSWNTAFQDLQDALDAARADPTVAAIWVAAGMYQPDRGTGSRDAAFELVGGVAVYGGFAGDEELLEERDPAVNITTLSGDLNDDDDNVDLDGDGLADFRNTSENSRNVVKGQDIGSFFLLDGFVIRSGNANYPPDQLRGGGAVLLVHTVGVVRGVTCQYNSAGNLQPETGGFGGGLLIIGGEVSVEQCTFQDNRGMNGGGLGISPYVSSGVTLDTQVAVIDCVFERNYSAYQTGGAAWTVTGDPFDTSVKGQITVQRCRIEGNQAEHEGGWVDQNTPHLLFEDCEFINNRAIGFGGAFTHTQTAGIDVEPALLRRCRMVGNQVGDLGAALLIEATNVILESCEIADNVGESIVRSGPIIGFQVGGKTLTVLDTIVRDNQGVGVLMHDSELLQVVNSTVVRNTSTVLQAGGILVEDVPAQVRNTILWDNAGTLNGQDEEIFTLDVPLQVSFCIVQELTGFPGGSGNLGDDPLFVDALAGDLHLLPTSPAIDAGDSSAAQAAGLVGDFENHPRFIDDPATPDTGAGPPPIVDIGAYEFQVGAGPGDLNCDGSIDFGDINPFVLYLSDVAAWQATYPDCPLQNGDINVDGSYPSFGDINPFVALLTGE
jgi:hypothetical protein